MADRNHHSSLHATSASQSSASGGNGWAAGSVNGLEAKQVSVSHLSDDAQVSIVKTDVHVLSSQQTKALESLNAMESSVDNGAVRTFLRNNLK